MAGGRETGRSNIVTFITLAGTTSKLCALADLSGGPDALKLCRDPIHGALIAAFIDTILSDVDVDARS